MGRTNLIGIIVAAIWAGTSFAAEGSLVGTWIPTEPLYETFTITFHNDGTFEFHHSAIGSSQQVEETRLYWNVESQADSLVVILAQIDAGDTERFDGGKLRIRFVTPDMIEVVGVEELTSGSEEEPPDRVVFLERQK